MKYLLPIIIMILWSSALFAVEVKHSLSRDTGRPWDLVVYEILIESDDPAQPIPIKSVSFITPLKGFQAEGDWQLDGNKASFNLRIFDIGSLEVPALELSYELDNELIQHKIPAIPFEVESQLNDDAELKDLKPLLRLKQRYAWLLWIIVGLLLLIGGFLLYWFKFRAADTEPEALPMHWTDSVAERIKSIRQNIEAGELLQSYDQLSHLLRFYLQHKLKIPALEMTTQELSRGWKRFKIDKDGILDFLQQADSIKFAKGKPRKDPLIQYLGMLETWMRREHKPQEEVAA